MTPAPSRPDTITCANCATRSVCPIAGLAAEELAALQPSIRKSSFRRGDALATEGEVARTLRVVKVGSVFGYRHGLDGRQRPIGIAGRGAAFGLFGVFAQKTQASGVAASAGRYCEIDCTVLRRLALANPEYSAHLTQAAVESCGRIALWSEAMRLRGTTNQLAYSLLLLAEAQRAPVIELPTHSALAELLGTTRETIARSLATLESEKSIRRMERKQCEVNRQALLSRIERSQE